MMAGMAHNYDPTRCKPVDMGGPAAIDGVAVRHVMGTWRGSRYQSCNWCRLPGPDGSVGEGEWKRKRTVRELWGPFFKHYKSLEISGVSFKEEGDGKSYFVSADEVLEPWDPFWTRESNYEDPYKIIMTRKRK
jgi:hypothetical protein